MELVGYNLSMVSSALYKAEFALQCMWNNVFLQQVGLYADLVT